MALVDVPLASALACSQMFGVLSESTLARLMTGTTKTFFKRGSIVFGRGAPATGVHVVVSGQLTLCINAAQGGEHVIEIVGPGGCVGEAETLTERPHMVTASAVTDSQLLHIARSTILAELDRDPLFARSMIRDLSTQLYRRTSDFGNVMLHKATARVARFIIDQLDAQGAKTGCHVQLPMPKGLIASRLNMTQEHFSRTLRELSTQGRIAVKGGLIDVTDEAGLRLLAA